MKIFLILLLLFPTIVFSKDFEISAPAGYSQQKILTDTPYSFCRVHAVIKLNEFYEETKWHPLAIVGCLEKNNFANSLSFGVSKIRKEDQFLTLIIHAIEDGKEVIYRAAGFVALDEYIEIDLIVNAGIATVFVNNELKTRFSTERYKFNPKMRPVISVSSGKAFFKGVQFKFNDN